MKMRTPPSFVPAAIKTKHHPEGLTPQKVAKETHKNPKSTRTFSLPSRSLPRVTQPQGGKKKVK